jgi:chemotaxis family two-component system response regulator Rcp1
MMDRKEQKRPLDIMLAEDSNADVKLISKALAETKIIHNLHVAHDGEEALRFIYKKPPFEKAANPDVILLDLNLPKVNGKEILRLIKRDDHFLQIPIIILSTSDAEQDIRDAYQLHANCYICKPRDIFRWLEVFQMITTFWLKAAQLPSSQIG